MTAAVTYVDELVKDYLMFRGCISTLKTLDSELKNDKEHGYRVDKIVEQLTNCVSNYDLNLLRETWSHLDRRVFSKSEFGSSISIVTKLEASLYRMYIVNCVSNNKNDKLMEFFEKMSGELQGISEWKEWFVIPFLKSVDEHPSFSMYFSRSWMETMLVSLHNFISISLHTMTVPALLAYDFEQAQIVSLKEENDMLRQQIIALKQSQGIAHRSVDSSNFVKPDLMDDFYIIAQEPHSSDTQIKGIKSIIRNIGSGLPISPILNRRLQSISHSVSKQSTEIPENSEASIPANTTSESVNSSSKLNVKTEKKSHATNKIVTSKQKSNFENKPMSTNLSPKLSNISKDAESSKKKIDSKVVKSGSSIIAESEKEAVDTTDSKKKSIETDNQVDSPYILLSQDKFSEHHGIITHCKFNALGSSVASSDMNGVIKIWSSKSTIKTNNTVVSRSSVLSLEWVGKGDRMLLHGNKSGILRLYDTQENRNIAELTSDAKVSLKDYSMLNISCSPVRSAFAVSTAYNKVSSHEKNKLLDCDTKTMKIQHTYSMNKLPAATFNCCIFNHNGQLLLGGTSDGRIALFDVRCNDCIACWVCHEDIPISTVQFSSDETTCYSLGADNQFNCWSMNKTGFKLNQYEGPKTASNSSVGKSFCLHSEKNLVLMCGQNGGVLKQVTETSLSTAMNLGGHKLPVATVDWSSALDCGMCVTASDDGIITVSTLLAR